jgi:Arc/MetJ-type ribon-helix-helix transcriptional regulator
MAIQLRADLEEIVLEDVQSGPYQDVDEYLERAVTMLHAQERWLAAHRDEIAAKFGNGLKSANQGELFDVEQVKEIMHERKQAWVEHWGIQRS